MAREEITLTLRGGLRWWARVYLRLAIIKAAIGIIPDPAKVADTIKRGVWTEVLRS
jgi:hypothetical protein